MRIGKKSFIVILGIITLIIVGGYYGTAFVVYEQLTAVESQCERSSLEGKRDNTPNEFLSRFSAEEELVAMSELSMPIYEDVTIFSREDNLRLSGWFIAAPVESEHVVLIIHGIHSCKRDSTVLIPAGMLHNNGFNVLIIDLRNHGESEIQDGRTAAGNREYNDVLGAFDWLQEQGYEADNIGLLGISLGAGISAIAFGEEPDIPVLWLDSPFGNIREVAINELELNNLPTFLVTPAFQIARLNGIDFLERSPEIAINNHQNRPIMVVHGTADERVPFRFGQQVYDNAGPNAQFIPFEGLLHVEAMYSIPDIYEAELIAFFNDNLVNQE